MPTQTELDIFTERMLVPIGNLPSRRLPPKVVGFFARKGDAYNGQLMIVGRAVKGWTLEATPAELKDPAVARDFAERLGQEMADAQGCPMSWVRDSWGGRTGYNTKDSAFWRVARRTTIELGIASESSPDWASRLAWSNLYKVAPPNGNPSDGVCSAQEPGCIELLREEIRLFQPQRLLFMTGLWATPFLRELPWVQREDRGTTTNVHLIGTIDNAQVVVATHPMTRAEDPWVREVVEAFRSFD